MTTKTLNMYSRVLTSELEQKARKELDEVPDRREADLKHVRHWLSKQPHLKARTDELWLLNFLRSCKFSQQRTKERLEFFYTMRSAMPELFTKRDPLLPEIQEILIRGIFLPLTSPDVDILLIRWQNADPNKISLSNLIKVGLMIFEIFLNESNTCIIIGQQVIEDFHNFSLSYMKQAPPIILKNVFTNILKGYPVRIKGFHLINAPVSVETVLNVVKTFLGRKIQDRIKVHHEDETNTLNEAIPRRFLPKEYGGEAHSVDEIAVKWKKKVESYREWFSEDEQYGVDETKRPTREKIDFDDIYGVEGCFRRLEID